MTILGTIVAFIIVFGVLVFIHEFGHYVDLYYFQRNILNDISDDFYAISWEQSNILKPSLTLNHLPLV